MKLLIWVSLLGIALAAGGFFDRVKDRFRGRNRRFGKLSERAKTELRKNWGIDPEQRKARFERIRNKIAKSKLSEEQKAKLHERLKKITHVKTEKPTDDAVVDLFDVNDESGVAEYLFQGDMFLTDDQLDAVENELSADGNRAKRQASTVHEKWTDNTVYYYFDSSINARKKASVAAALDYLGSHTCIDFIKSSSAANRIRVYSGDGCFSSVGMIGGQQDLSLGDGCEVMGTVAHEFTHALGIWHTQMRADRDDYVSIDLSTVKSGKEHNFAKLTANEMTSYTPYEYGSFMHYSANSFTLESDEISIVPEDERYVYTMGNRLISFYDIKMINEHYGCSAKCDPSTSAQCQNGGVPNPRNCAVCNCPYGYSGATCTERPSGCGSTLSATSSWKTVSYSYGDEEDSTNVRDVFTLCNHWINAPAGQQVEVKITSMYNPQCQYGCPFNGLEIKGDPEQEKTNPRICCPEFNNVVYRSYLNPTPIISFNRYYYTSFTLQYRAVGAIPGNITTLSPTTTTKTTTTTKRKTTSTTTTRPAPSTNCQDQNTAYACANNKLAGFCTSTDYSFQTIKWNCGRTCGLCGQSDSPCVDYSYDCDWFLASGQCESRHPMDAEYFCASTCGFCQNPN